MGKILESWIWHNMMKTATVSIKMSRRRLISVMRVERKAKITHLVKMDRGIRNKMSMCFSSIRDL